MNTLRILFPDATTIDQSGDLRLVYSTKSWDEQVSDFVESFNVFTFPDMLTEIHTGRGCLADALRMAEDHLAQLVIAD